MDDVMRRLDHFGRSDADPIWLWTETVSDTPQDQETLQKFIRDHNIALVIIDTLATYLMLRDETDNSNVTVRLRPYLDMAHTTGATIIFVHHERKNRDEGGDDSRAIRGGGAILAVVDLAFQLQRATGGGTPRHLRITGRYQEIPRSLKLDYGDEEYVLLGTSEDHTRDAQRARIVEGLPTESPGLTVKEAAAKAGFKENATRVALEEALGKKRVDRSGLGRRGDPWRYFRIVASGTTPDLANTADGKKETGSASDHHTTERPNANNQTPQQTSDDWFADDEMTNEERDGQAEAALSATDR
jgi:hypothetical protein